MPENTVIWLWVGNVPAISAIPATNVTQAELNAAGMPGYEVTGQQEIAPVSVTGTRTSVPSISQPVFTAPFNAPGGFVSEFGFESPTTPGPVSGQTIQTAFRATVTLTEPDGSTTTQIATIIQMSNGDLFLRPNPNFLPGWDGIQALQTITFDAVQPFAGNTVFDSVISFNPSIFDLPIVCFTAGTMIATPEGPRAVESLQPGDRVLTADHGAQALRWIGRRDLGAQDLVARPELRPIRLAAGALGAGLPATELVVSPQHRLLVRSRIAARMFGAAEVLVAAVQLVGLPGITRMTEGGTSYLHLMCDRHEIIFANGAPAETLLAGPMALRALGPAAVAEVTALFPELAAGLAPAPARPLVKGRVARRMAERHRENRKALIAA